MSANTGERSWETRLRCEQMTALGNPENSTPHRTVVVTGASAGVGRATAVAFAKLGYDVALLARHGGRLEDACMEVRSHGARAIALPTDVADAVAVERAADRVFAEWGSIDVWVNCAMVTVFAPFGKLTPDEFRRVTEVTYLGYVHGTMAALKHMRSRDRGVIVQVGSALAYRAIPLQSAYCGAKFAIRGFTDAVRTELLHDGSRIWLTMVQLPAVNTPQFDWARNKLPRRPQPVPPVVEPEIAAQAVVKSAFAGARELWVGASSVKAIAGNMVAPQLLDRLAAKQGYQGQMSEEPAGQSEFEHDNLFVPGAASHGTRGRFSQIARHKAMTVDSGVARSSAAWLAAGLSLAVAACVLRASARSRGPQPKASSLARCCV